MKKWIENIIYISFGIMILALLAIISFFQKVKYMCKPSYVIPNIVIMVILLLIIILGSFCRSRKNRIFYSCHLFFSGIDSDRLVKRIIIVLFFFQIYECYNIIFLSDWDVSVIWNASNQYAAGDYVKVAENYYFHQYPNNLLFMIVQAFIVKMHTLLGVFEGERGQLMSVAVINCSINSGTCFLVYKSAKLLCTLKNSLFAFIASIFLVGISPWTAINYSDAMSLIFPILTFYLYVCPRKCTWKRKLSQLGAIFVGCVSYFLKPQCFIMVIAILLIAILIDMKELKLKNILTVGGLYLFTFLCLFGVNKGIHSVLESKGIHIDKEREFGVSHFLMMGLNVERNGVFSEEDVGFSKSFISYKERSNANLNVAVKRINEMGSVGLLKHLVKKMLVTYSDGMFAWGMEGVFFFQMYDCPNNKAAPFMRALFYRNGQYRMIFATFEQFMWILVLILCACSSISMMNGKRNELMLLMLSLIGLTTYFLLFEARARYLYTYIPVYCILAAVGKQQVQVAIQNFMNGRKEKIIEKKESLIL